MTSEPYSGRDIVKWMADRYRPTLLPTADGSTRLYELPSGATVMVPGPSSDRKPVSTYLAKQIATQLGMSFDEFRAAIGFPVIKHGHPSRKPVKVEKKGCSRAEVLRCATALRMHVSEVERLMRQGAPRDSAFYLEIHALLHEGLVQARQALEKTTKVGARNAR